MHLYELINLNVIFQTILVQRMRGSVKQQLQYDNHAKRLRVFDNYSHEINLAYQIEIFRLWYAIEIQKMLLRHRTNTEAGYPLNN